MDDLEVEVSKIEQSSGLAMVEVLGLTEVHQVLVVGEDLDGEGRAMEIMSPRLQGMDDDKQLLIIDVVVSFGGDERLQEVGARVPVVIRVSLEEDRARGVLGSVGSDSKRFGEVGEMEDRA